VLNYNIVLDITKFPFIGKKDFPLVLRPEIIALLLWYCCDFHLMKFVNHVANMLPLP
jgi:hypothetical protein